MRKRVTQNSHQKRYGQYFSGPRVADLLTSLLPEGAEICSAIDPMAGVGDLLRPILSNYGARKVLAIEIDAPVAKCCADNLPDAKVINADAFSCVDAITPDGWDLVITNPPYVRYQLQDGADGKIGSSHEIRDNLRKQIISIRHLSSEDKSFFLGIVQHYSGLSDMAVPSWILSAALVKMDGFLAIVVPDTWLSREYATPVQYMLSKCFDVITIVKDTDAVWFENALVRTCLVIAQRRSTLPLTMANSTTLCLDIESSIAGEKTLVAGMMFDGKTGLTALSALLASQTNICGNGFAVTHKSINSLFPHMLNGVGVEKWIHPDDFHSMNAKPYHPAEIDSLLDECGRPSAFISLDDLQIECGQGLRTGANDFFYLTIQGQSQNCYFVNSKPWQHSDGNITIPQKNVIKTLQNRNQIKGLVATASDLNTGVLYIENEIRSADIDNCDSSMHYSILADGVSAYISAAEQFRNSHGLAFKEYSAVKPNERKTGELYTRFWYMLPKLNSRHLPVLCLTRVNSSQPECLFVSQSNAMPIAVDANFVTLWGKETQAIKATFTLLNSTWTKCYLETLCTVMGGGALKLEAAQLKKIQFPQYTKTEFKKIAEIGEELIEKGTIDDTLQGKIDQATLNPFPNPNEMLQQLKALLRKKLSERGARK